MQSVIMRLIIIIHSNFRLNGERKKKQTDSLENHLAGAWTNENIFICFDCRKIGFYGVFTMAGLLYSLALFYGIFILNEVPPKNSTTVAQAATAAIQKPAEKKSFLADFFDLAHVRETFCLAFKSGEKHRRSKIIMLMVVVIIVVGPQHGMSLNW